MWKFPVPESKPKNKLAAVVQECLRSHQEAEAGGLSLKARVSLDSKTVSQKIKTSIRNKITSFKKNLRMFYFTIFMKLDFAGR